MIKKYTGKPDIIGFLVWVVDTFLDDPDDTIKADNLYCSPELYAAITNDIVSSEYRNEKALLMITKGPKMDPKLKDNEVRHN